MCLVHFQLNHHATYKLILGANRDEFYNRPTEPLHYWPDAPILAGRDLTAMGTWLGVTKTGRIALLTNIRNKKEMSASYQTSRGGLVTGFLNSHLDPAVYLESLKTHSHEYAGFNLIVGDVTGSNAGLLYMNNTHNDIIHISPGIHGLSNHHLDTPWPKVTRGNNKLSALTAHDFSEDDIFQMLYDRTKAEDKYLPDTGVPRALESSLSPMFINMDEYGTRCSTVLTVTHDNIITLTERTYMHGQSTGDVRFQFKIQAPV